MNPMSDGALAARRVRIAVCGFGASATWFHLPLCSREPFERVIAFDPVVERRGAALDAGFAAAADVRDMSALIRDQQIDVVVTTSPSLMHAEHAMTALRAGAHTIVDKPVASSASAFARLLAVAAEEKRAIVPFHNRGFDEDHRIALALLREGRLGRLLRVESAVAQWGPSSRFAVRSFRPQWRTEARYGGGALADWGPHKLDQLLDIFDRAMPDDVAAATARGIWSNDVDDVVDAWIRWGEVTAHLVISFAERMPLPRLRLVGSEATLTMNGDDAEGVVVLDSVRASREEWRYRNDISAASAIYSAAACAATDGDLRPAQTMSRRAAGVYRLMDVIREVSATPVRRARRTPDEVVLVTDDGEWDDFLDRAAGSTLFHSSRWTAVSPRDFKRLGVRVDGVLQAGVIAEVDERGRGTRGSLAPYLGVLACVGTGASTLRTLARALAEQLPSARFPVSPWSGPVHDVVCGNDFRARLLYTCTLDLSDLAQTWKRFALNLRRNIAAAERQLVVSDEGIDDLRPLVEKTFQRQGVPVWFDWREAKQCFESLAANDRARCVVVRDGEGNAVAGAGVVWDDHRAYYLLGGYDATRRHRGASSLALWRAMQFVREHANVRLFDLEGSHHPAIHRFFDRFGGDWLPFAVITPGAEGYE